MIRYSFHRSFFTTLCLASLVAPAWAAQAAITAQLHSQSLRVGESTQLAVTVKGSQPAPPNIPQVDGLEIVPVSQHHALRMVNGAVMADVTHTYQVTPNRAGSFTIPAIAAPNAGITQPIGLRVDKNPHGQTRRTPSQGGSQLPAPSLGDSDSDTVDSQNRSAFLRVVLPKKELTVGELVPVEVKAYFRAGVSASLNGLPVLSSDAFTLNKLGDQPKQTQEVIDDVPYTVVTWTSALSAVKAGEYPLNLDLPVMVRVKEKNKRGGRNPFKDFFGEDSPFDSSMFDDPFFDNFFGGVTEKPLTLHTDGTVVKIKPLPTQDRPADFSGAVGQFELSSEASATTGTTGNPLTLKTTITGRGNFDRVSTNGLPAEAAWKSYKPNARFEPADSAGVSGTKTFEQSIIPTKTGAQEIPALRFSYFDPEVQKYVTKTTAPIAVDIAQVSQVAPAAPPTTSPQMSSDGLAPDQAVPVHASASLRPLVLNPWFIAINAAMAAATGAGAIFNRLRQRRANDPQRSEREAAERSLNESLAAMDAALKNQDAPRFFSAARHALQERLAAQWQLPAKSVTIHEIRSRLNGRGEELRSIFQTADEIAYSGRRFTAPDLQRWRDLVKTQLNQIARL